MTKKPPKFILGLVLAAMVFISIFDWEKIIVLDWKAGVRILGFVTFIYFLPTIYDFIEKQGPRPT